MSAHYAGDLPPNDLPFVVSQKFYITLEQHKIQVHYGSSLVCVMSCKTHAVFSVPQTQTAEKPFKPTYNENVMTQKQKLSKTMSLSFCPHELGQTHFRSLAIYSSAGKLSI